MASTNQDNSIIEIFNTPNTKQPHNMSSYGSDSKIVYVNVADPSWSIDRKLAWLRRREYLRNHKDAIIPDDCVADKEYHRWWHTKGKFQTMKHYVDGQQPIY